MSKSEADFQASINMLQAALGMYEAGLKDGYRVVATELRKLLCAKNPLLPRVRPDFKLHKLHWTELLEGCPSLADGMAFMTPGRLSISRATGTYHFELMFGKSGELMEPEEWVRQPFLSPSITIWELIKSVADKEGAHSDPDYNDTLVQAKIVKYVEADSHIPAIVALGDYLMKCLQEHGSNLPRNRTSRKAVSRTDRRGETP
jgi:hypothetical protein